MKKVFALLLAMLLLCGCGAIKDHDGRSNASVPHSENYFGDFKAETLDGNAVTQDIFAQADLTVVNLWGTFCGPCISEMPTLGKLHNELDNVQFVGIVLDCTDRHGNPDAGQVQTAKDIMVQAGASYPCLILNEDLMDLGMANYQYIPTTLFVNSNGDLVGSEVVGAMDEDAWRGEITSRLEMIGK